MVFVRLPGTELPELAIDAEGFDLSSRRGRGGPSLRQRQRKLREFVVTGEMARSLSVVAAIFPVNTYWPGAMAS